MIMAQKKRKWKQKEDNKEMKLDKYDAKKRLIKVRKSVSVSVSPYFSLCLSVFVCLILSTYKHILDKGLTRFCRGEQLEPWVGLVHDGSQNGNNDNFRWLDTGSVSFLPWPSGEPNGLPADGCVRIRSNSFGTKQCTHFGYSAVCQPSGDYVVVGGDCLMSQQHASVSQGPIEKKTPFKTKLKTRLFHTHLC